MKTSKLFAIVVVGGASLAGCGDDGGEGASSGTGGGSGSGGDSATGGAPSSGGSSGLDGSVDADSGADGASCCPAECWVSPCDCAGGVCCWLSFGHPLCESQC